jgi:SNF2 family DNA or RNA helicase
MTRMETAKHQGGLLSDEMGLGKVRPFPTKFLMQTIQTIACILINKPKNDTAARLNPSQSVMSNFFNAPAPKTRRSTLIILPLSLMDQWESEMDELIKPGHKLRVLKYHNDCLKIAERRRFDANPDIFATYDGLFSPRLY